MGTLGRSCTWSAKYFHQLSLLEEKGAFPGSNCPVCCKQMGWALAALRMCGHVLACLYELPVCAWVSAGEEAEEELLSRSALSGPVVGRGEADVRAWRNPPSPRLGSLCHPALREQAWAAITWQRTPDP